jgi:hypothetical protein
MTLSSSPDSEAEAAANRQLALVDRIIGLEAQLANLRAQNAGAVTQAQVAEVKASATWRAGRVVLAPFSLVKRVLSRPGRRRTGLR